MLGLLHLKPSPPLQGRQPPLEAPLPRVWPALQHPVAPPTSLSRDASRCRDRSDMRKWRVVSAEGWGPGFSGANCTFRITSRTEFLGAGRRGQTDSRRGRGRVLTPHFSPPTRPGSWEVMVRPKGGGCFPHLLWLFSSTDLAQKARISKSTPQALRGGEKVTSYTSPCRHHHSLPSRCLRLGQPLLPHHALRRAGPRSSSSVSARPGTRQRSDLAVRGEPPYAAVCRS